MATLKIPTDTSQATLGYLLADGTIVGATSQAQAFVGLATGALGDYDLNVGDVTTPDYGIIRMGDSCMGRTSHNVASLDLDGAVIFRNMGGPVTGQIEFVFTESGAGAIRFALAKAGVGNATYNPRSMLLAGPAVNNDDVVTVGHWQGQGIFDNLACDTAGDGADLGVQNDLEVEGDIFTDSILESTTAAGVTIDSVLLKDGEVGPLADNKALILGTGDDAKLYWDGTDLIVSLPSSADNLRILNGGIRLPLNQDITDNAGSSIGFSNVSGQWVDIATPSGTRIIGGALYLGTTGDVAILDKDAVGVIQVFGSGVRRYIDGGGTTRMEINATTPMIDITGSAMIDGDTDEVQLIVQGHSAQNADVFVVEKSDGVDLFTVDNSGNAVMPGSDVSLAITDGRLILNRPASAGAEPGQILSTMDATVTGSRSILAFSYKPTVNAVSSQKAIDITGRTSLEQAADLTIINIDNSLGDTAGFLTVGNLRGIDMRLSYADDVVFGGSTLSNLEFITLNSPVYPAGTETITDVRGIKMANLGNSQVGTSIPLDIAAQSGSTTPLSIRVLGSGVSIHQPDLSVGSTGVPTSTVDINGSFAAATVAKTGAYTAAIGDHVITCDASGGAFTVTLPAASGVVGRIYHIKKTDSSGNAVTVDGNSGETIDDALTQAIITQYDSMMIACDGSNWHII